jgi:hypothetical protein
MKVAEVNKEIFKLKFFQYKLFLKNEIIEGEIYTLENTGDQQREGYGKGYAQAMKSALEKYEDLLREAELLLRIAIEEDVDPAEEEGSS